MNRFISKVIALLLLPALYQPLVAQTGIVQNPAKRQEAIDKGHALLAPREATVPSADPFHSEAFAEVVGGMGRVPGVVQTEAPRVGPRSDRDLLEAIATSIQPSGYFILGGEATLVFGQKRVKAGSTLTINFEGTEYTLEITALDRTNFTLRLNREEFTRPIK